MQFFVSDPQVELQILGPPGPIIVPPPPYWFGGKSFAGALPLAREIKARLIIPANISPGQVRWQVANANGGSGPGKFLISKNREVVEDNQADEPQALGDLPVTVSGQLALIEEVDWYQFTTPDTGPITLHLEANLARVFNGIVKILDATNGATVADAAGTDQRPTVVTFTAKAGATYQVSVHDVDFRGNRSYVYRLHVRRGPRIMAAMPAGGRRGETVQIEFIGIGVKTGQAQLESVSHEVTFPDDPAIDHLEYQVPTDFGPGQPFRLLVSDLAEDVTEPAGDEGPQKLSPPCAITGRLAKQGEKGQFQFAGTKDQQWRISVACQQIGTFLDPILVIIGPDGQPLAENDDLPGTSDAGVDVTLPTDGTYQVVVRDLAGQSGHPTAVYRLAIEPSLPEPADFTLESPPNMNLVIGGKAELVVKAARKGGFNAPIQFHLSDLPTGVSATGDLVMAADQAELKIPLESSADAPSGASIVSLTATAELEGVGIRRTTQPLLICSTMKPRCKVTPLEKDGGRAVHAGTTFPAEVIIERLEGFQGEVRLEMASNQSRHRQGISGPEIVVPPDVSHTIYPVFAPEWLETIRTSRMVCNAVVVVPDSQNNPRYLLNQMTGRITMSLEGALLKISHGSEQIRVQPGDTFEIPLKVTRSAKLKEQVHVELRPTQELEGLFAADPVVIQTNSATFKLPVTTAVDSRLTGQIALKIRATAIQNGKYPAISETTVNLVVE